MGEHNFPTMAEEHSQHAHYYGDNEDWLIVFSVHRDSDDVDRANWRAFNNAMATIDPEEEFHTIERSSHGAVGWVDYLIVDPKATDLINEATQIREKLEDYPIICEDTWSEVQMEDEAEAWENYGRSEFEKLCRDRFSSLNDDMDIDLIEEIAGEELSEEWLNEKFQESSPQWKDDSCGWSSMSAEGIDFEEFPESWQAAALSKEEYLKLVMADETMRLPFPL